MPNRASRRLTAFWRQRHGPFAGRNIGLDRLDRARRAPLDALVHREAQKDCSYLFENVSFYDAGRRGALTDPVFRAAFDLIRSDRFVALGRALTGDDAISFADCQLTRYRPGHFLTSHDDGLEGKNRSAAFVLNLSISI